MPFPKRLSQRIYKNKTTRFRVVLNEMRQRPMLPVGGPTSTFGAGKLNFCVRNGNRWILSAMVTAMVYITLFRAEYIYIVSEDSQLHSRLFKQRIFFQGSCARKTVVFVSKDSRIPKYLFLIVLRSSPRPISIGQLNTLLHLHFRPINLVVCKGSYYLTIWETLS